MHDRFAIFGALPVRQTTSPVKELCRITFAKRNGEAKRHVGGDRLSSLNESAANAKHTKVVLCEAMNLVFYIYIANSFIFDKPYEVDVG